MKTNTLFLVAAAGIAAFFLLKPAQAQVDSGTGGAGSPDVVINLLPPDLSTSTSPMTADTSLNKKSSPSNTSLASVNRTLAAQSGATSGFSTPTGEVYTMNGSIIGGSDAVRGASLSSQGAAQSFNPFGSKVLIGRPDLSSNPVSNAIMSVQKKTASK